MPNITLPKLQPIQGYAVASRAASLAPRFAPAGVGSIGSSVARAGAVSGLGASMLFSPVIGALLSGGTALLGQYLQNRASLDAEKRARAYALEDRLHDELYNSPAMQKLRLEQAGLSPAEYVQQFETSSQTPEVQVPDFSMLAGAGGSALSGAYSAISAQSDLRKMSADIRLLEAEADSKRAEADTARKRYDLEIANKTLENSKLGKDLNLMELAISGKVIENKSALLDYIFNKETHRYRVDALSIANRLSELDEKQKAIALEIAEKTKALSVELLSGQVEGIKLDNDLKKLNIKGKQYELDEILPRQVVEMDDKHKYSEQQLINLGLQTGILSLESMKANVQYEVIASNYEKYIESLSNRLNTDFNTAKLASRMSILTYLMNQGNSMLSFLEGVAKFATK